MTRISRIRSTMCMPAAIGLAFTLAAASAAESGQGMGDVLVSFPESAYIGGMPPMATRLAARARLDMQASRGEALPMCEPPGSDPRQGQIIATGIGGEPPPSEPPSDPVLVELLDLLRHERRFVRDAAAYVIAEIGPAARMLESHLSGEDIHRSPWLTHALGRITCDSYGMVGNDEFVPAEAKSRLIGKDNDLPLLGTKVRLVASLLEDTTLVWPDSFFSSFIPASEREKTGALDSVKPASVLAIVDRVMDESASHSLRGDLVDLLHNLGKAASPASGPLWKLANGPDDTLAYEAASALMEAGAAHALDAAGVMVMRFDTGFSWLPEDLCQAPGAAEVLGPYARKELTGTDWKEAGKAAKWLGCLDPEGNAALLREHLDHPSWETQIAIIKALSTSAQSNPETRKALRDVQHTHWSGLVRREAAESLDPPPPKKQDTGDVKLEIINLACFHRCLTDHLRQCGDGNGIVDGLYVSPSMGELDIEWERARRIPKPAGFPAEVHESSRSGYGTSTYLRVDGGWLYGTDRWHYDGFMGFIDDQGRESRIGQWGDDVVAFVDTPHFGPVMLGNSLFAVGHAGLLAQVKRDANGWTLIPRITLPSPPWGWALAPNGTLLVADPYEAVAVLEDGSIESLACPARKPSPRPRSLLAMTKGAPHALATHAQRDADDAVTLLESIFLTEKARVSQLKDDPTQREKPEVVQRQLDDAFDGWLNALLEAGRAEDALRALYSTSDDVATVSPALRFQIHAVTGRIEQARMSFVAPSRQTDEDALSMQAMLALAEGRKADAGTALDRLQELTDNSLVRQGEDPYVQLLRGLVDARWPGTDSDEWPGPLQAYLAGRSSEKALVLASHTRDGRIDRERLSEALFYNGLKLVAQGESRRARMHFSAVTALQVLSSQEYGVATIVLASMSADR